MPWKVFSEPGCAVALGTIFLNAVRDGVGGCFTHCHPRAGHYYYDVQV